MLVDNFAEILEDRVLPRLVNRASDIFPIVRNNPFAPLALVAEAARLDRIIRRGHAVLEYAATIAAQESEAA